MNRKKGCMIAARFNIEQSFSKVILTFGIHRIFFYECQTTLRIQGEFRTLENSDTTVSLQTFVVLMFSPADECVFCPHFVLYRVVSIP